jgi:leader peptidase (prepilin peptidase)/N-methyltransferase
VELSERESPSRTPEEGARAWALVAALPHRTKLLIGVASVALAAGCFVRFGFSGRAVVGAAYASVLILLAAIDFHRRLIPNVIVVPAIFLVLAAQIVLDPDRTLEWVLAALGAGLFFYIPAVVFPAGLGMGDVKLAALIGAALGKSVVGALFVTLLAGALYGILVLTREGWRARTKAIPYGPFLVLGGLLALFIGDG